MTVMMTATLTVKEMLKSVYNFFCQNNCVQNPCKSNATCQSGFTEKG